MYGVIKYIDEHIEEKLTIDDVARVAGYSKWHFCSLFRRFTGMPVVGYINDRKMQYAAIDILNGQSLLDVTFKYGFDTCGGFNKAFLRKFGCYPTQFRKIDAEFHVRYKEKMNKMYQLTDRCAILRDNVMYEKTLERKAGHTFKVYQAIGSETAPKGLHNAEIHASGLCSVIDNFRPYVIDGELIVGYNFGYEGFGVQKTADLKDKLIEEGFPLEDINALYNCPGVNPYKDAPRVDYDECRRIMSEEWTAIGKAILTDHNVLSYESVLRLGFSGLLEKVKACADASGDSPLYRATARICESACKMGEKYAKEAERLAESDDITPERKKELLKISETCKRVPRYSARSFVEAVQSLWFAHIIATWEDGCVNANSLGRLDQILYPYYIRDVESGAITKEEAYEIVCCLWIKLYRDYDVQQSCVGGVTPSGEDAVNDLSYMMLDATEALDFVRCLSVRFSAKTSPAFLKRALEVVGHLQKGVPFFFNDDVIIPSLVNAGIKLEDARNYTQIGCVETVIPGKSNPHACTGEANFLKAIEYALNDGKSAISGIKIDGVEDCPTASINSYEMLKEVVMKHLDNILTITCQQVVKEITSRDDIVCRPYKSLLTEGCLETNRDFNNHGALYDYYQIMLCGIPNLADSLIAVKKLVFEEGKYTFSELVDAIRNDFPSERMRLDLVNNAPKFGNDVDEVDMLASEIIDFACDVLERESKISGFSFHAQPFTYLWLIEHGKTTGATPDGRRRGENIAYSISPMQGRDFSGLTAVLNSITKIPTKRIPGTASAIIESDPHLFADRHLDTLTEMMLVLAERGLSNVQFNIVDAETLMEAKNHPEKFANLAVRVSGFSQKFCLLDDQLQDHIIARTKHKCL